MRVLIIGGTGLISVGVVRHLLQRSAQVTMLNRGQRGGEIPPGVEVLRADRDDEAAMTAAIGGRRFDTIIDMVCYRPQQAEMAVRLFAGRCTQYIFCSTVCTYGVKIAPGVLIDETFPQEPTTGYGREKMEAEKVFLRAGAQGAFAATIIRPSHTYGPGGPLIDQLEFNPVAWDRIERGLPVLCAGDGLGLWQSTHRDDVGKMFAHAVLEPRTYGQDYNAVRDEVFTWRDYYRQVGEALGKPARLLFMPAEWIVRHDRNRFNFLDCLTRYHGAYSAAKARRDVPAFCCTIGFTEGAAETLADLRRRGAIRPSDDAYQAIVDAAIAFGTEPVEA